MKAKCFLIFVAAALAIAGIVCLGFDAYYMRKQPVFNNAPKLVSAVAAFSQEMARRGQAVPTTVSLTKLISGRYISADDVRAFQGMDVQIWLSAADTLPVPDSVVISAQLPDGSINAALADGSIQQFSPQHFREQLRKAGQQKSSANGSQPIRSETNRTSSTAGSRR